MDVVKFHLKWIWKALRLQRIIGHDWEAHSFFSFLV
jgi:hypothetical protein